VLKAVIAHRIERPDQRRPRSDHLRRRRPVRPARRLHRLEIAQRTGPPAVSAASAGGHRRTNARVLQEGLVAEPARWRRRGCAPMPSGSVIEGTPSEALSVSPAAGPALARRDSAARDRRPCARAGRPRRRQRRYRSRISSVVWTPDRLTSAGGVASKPKVGGGRYALSRDSRRPGAEPRGVLDQRLVAAVGRLSTCATSIAARC
jgi:hypothetical protein